MVHNVWARNLGFLALALVGLGVFTSRLLPTNIRAPQPNRSSFDQDPTFRATVESLDEQFRKAWQAADLLPAPQASEWTIYRRLSLGLTGTIPSLEEIRLLERLTAEERLDWWLDRLLDDRRFSDYLAERLARSYVGTEGGPFLVYRRRRFVTWLSDEIEARRPYDELVRQLISGSGIWTDSPSVNFLTVTNDVNGDEQPDEERLAARTARAFLGVRLDCVQCHDDNLGGDWLQQDFQQLAAFYADASSSLLGIHDDPTDYEFQYLGEDATEVVPAKVPFAQDVALPDTSRRAQLAAWVTSRDNPAFARAIVNRIWATLFGRPLVAPVDDLPLEGPFPVGLELLAHDFAQHGHDLRRLIRVIAKSQTFQRSSRHPDGVTENHEDHWAVFPLTQLRPEQVAGSLIQASSLSTIDAESHVFVRFIRHQQQEGFVQRFGDTGEDEFTARSGTIPQRLLMMNGELVGERTGDNLVGNAVSRIAALTRDNELALVTSYLTVLTRRPTTGERRHFLNRLADSQGSDRREVLEDLYWALFNSAEFQWNH